MVLTALWPSTAQEHAQDERFSITPQQAQALGGTVRPAGEKSAHSSDRASVCHVSPHECYCLCPCRAVISLAKRP